MLAMKPLYRTVIMLRRKPIADLLETLQKYPERGTLVQRLFVQTVPVAYFRADSPGICEGDIDELLVPLIKLLPASRGGRYFIFCYNAQGVGWVVQGRQRCQKKCQNPEFCGKSCMDGYVAVTTTAP